jgi:hypothetical protein
MPVENVGDDPGRDIDRPAGGKGNDDRDRSRGIILRLRVVHAGRSQQQNRRGYQMLCHLSSR